MSQTISNYVKNLRKESGLSVEEFATQYGISHAQVSKYESGELDQCSLLIASNFCSTFGIDADTFLSEFNYYNLTSINDTFGIKVALEHKIHGDSNAFLFKNLNAFFSKYSKELSLSSLDIIKETKRNIIFSEIANISPIATCSLNTSKSNKAYIFYFPYTKVPNTKSRTKYYSNLRNTIMSLISLDYSDINTNNFILLTPDYQQYYFFKNQKYYQRKNINIMLVCYRHNKELNYSNIVGNNIFIKKSN